MGAAEAPRRDLAGDEGRARQDGVAGGETRLLGDGAPVPAAVPGGAGPAAGTNSVRAVIAGDDNAGGDSAGAATLGDINEADAIGIADIIAVFASSISTTGINAVVSTRDTTAGGARTAIGRGKTYPARNISA